MTEDTKKLIVGKYEILNSIGKGGVGEVYRALQYPLERVVALKLLKPELGKKTTIRRRFAHEARAVASLNHPNIITVYDFGMTEDQNLFLAMEYIDGQSLRLLIEKGMPTIPSLLIIEQILSGLAHAHARGLIHRDLKPDNVLVCRVDDQIMAKIVDFGIAAVVGGQSEDTLELFSSHKVIGTPAYMSPEQAQGQRNLNHLSDIYNLGIILYEVVAGRHPFRALSPKSMMMAHCTEPAPRPLPRPGYLLPQGLEQIIIRCLAKEPSERYSSAADLKAAIVEVRHSLEDRGHALYLPVAPTSPGEPTGRITLVEGTPHVVSDGPYQVSSALDVPFVGREAERQTLLGLARQVHTNGRGLIVFIEGETGVGKTRLATWLKEELVEAGLMRGLAGRYLAEGSGGMRAIRESLEQLFGTRGMSTADTSARVASRLVSWNITEARDAGLLIETIRPPEQNDPGSSFNNPEQERLFTILAKVLQAAGEVHPILMIQDDIQWSDAQTTEFLYFLAREMKNSRIPLLVLCTLRSEELLEHPTLNALVSQLAVYEKDTLRRLRLGRLPPDEIRELVRRVLPSHDSLVDGVLRRSEGNPLYAIQIIHYLLSENLIAPNEIGCYMAAEGVRIEETVPPNLADLLLLRLARLEKRHGQDQPLMAVLECAAILGSRFPYETLAWMVNHERLLDLDQLDTLLDKLIDEGLLAQNPDQEEDLLDFQHNLIRDVLLERLAPRRSTRRLHRNAAEAKRLFFKDREELVAMQLAIHYELAHDFVNATSFSYLAGATSERMHRPLDAMDCWKRFLRCYGKVPTTTREALALPPREEVQVRLGELYEVLGWTAEAEESFRKLVPKDNQALSQATEVRAALGLASISLTRGQVFQAESLFEAAREAADGFSDSLLGAKAYLGLAKVSWHHGHAAEALEQAQLSFVVCRAADHHSGQVEALWFIGDVLRMTGELDQANASFELALNIGQSLDDPRGVARCLYGQALVARSANRLEQAKSLYERAYQELEALGARNGLGQCLNGLGEVARFRNQLEAARDHYKRAVDIFHSADMHTDAAVSLTNLGLVARDAGDLPGAREAMERALEVAEASNYTYLTLGIAFNLAWVHALMGEPKRCERLLDVHLDRALRYGLVDPDFASPLEGIASLMEAAGDTEEARRLYRYAREMWEELRRDRDASRVSALLG